MTDLAGVIESIVGIAAVGVKLARTLYQVGHGAAAPDHNVHRIAARVSTLSLTLNHLASILQGPQRLHTSAALDSLAQILKDLGVVFQDFTTLVVHAKDKGEAAYAPVPANGRRRRHSVVARAKWYFEQPYVDVLMAQLDYLGATLATMMKTLDIASASAHQARLPGSVPGHEEMAQHKIHLETLIVCQQLSVDVMNEARERYSEHQSTLSEESLPEIERATEQRYPKLLTQNSGSPIQPIRLCDDSLDFLDQKHAVHGDEGAPLEPAVSRSERVIDSLLRRWSTMFPSIPDTTPREWAGQSTDEAYEEARHTAGDLGHDISSGTAATADFDRHGTRATANSMPSDQRPRPVSPPQPIIRSPHPLLTGSYDTPAQFESGQNAKRGQTSEDDLYPAEHMPSDPSPLPSPRTSHSSWPAGPVAGTSATQALTTTKSDKTPQIAVPGHSNYRRPRVSSGSNSAASSDSEDAQPTNGERRTSESSKHSHHDSGIGDGLGIPWRIRISQAKYFDFRDERLVGPRTPYLPNEPRHWIYSHDNATTEISKKWIGVEAILEKRYAYVDLREEESGVALGGDGGAWRILQPLRFSEVEALVSRTIENFRQRSAVQSPTQTRPAARSPQPYLRVQSYQTQPSSIPQHPPQHRSVSYNDAVVSGGSTGARSPRTPSGPNALFPPEFSTAGPSGRTTSPYGRSPGSSYEWRDPHRDGHASSRRDRERPYERERDREHARDSWGADREHHRDKERERPISRSGKHRHRDRDKDRDKDRKEDKKKSAGGAIPMTLAKIGGLAALLEGLDGAF